MSESIPKIIITVEDGCITSYVADRPVHIVIIDYDMRSAGGTIGQIIQHIQPDDIRSPQEIEATIINTTNELIDKGY